MKLKTKTKSFFKKGRARFTFKDRHTVVLHKQDSEGKTYAEMRDGSIRRVSPLKPWSGKSERRQVIKLRREK